MNLSKSLFLVGTIFWIWSILLAKENYYTLFISSTGIRPATVVFTPLLWVGLFFAVLGVVSSKDHDLSLALQLALIAVMFHFSLTLFQENARAYDSYTHFGNAKAILETQHTDPAEFGYDSWPGTFLWGAIVQSVLGVSGKALIYYFPLFFSAVIALALYIVARRLSTSSRREAPVAFTVFTVIAFLAENNSLQTHFSPQAIGLLMTIFFAYALILVATSLKASSSHILLTIVLFASVTTTHPPSTLVTLFALIIVSLMRLKQLGAWPWAPTFSLLVTCAAIFTSWQVYQVFQFSPRLIASLATLMSLIFGGLHQAEYFVVSIPRDPFLANLSILRHLFFFIVASYGFFRMLRARDRILSIVLPYGFGAAGLFVFLLAFLGGMLWERVLLFGAFPVALSVAYTIQTCRARFRRVLMASTLVFLVINAYVIYAAEPENMVPTSELTTVDFVLENIQARSTTVYANAPISFKDPFYVLRNVFVLTPVEFTFNDFTEPRPGVCYVIVPGTMQILLGTAQFYELMLQMNGKMSRPYSSNFDTIYLVTVACG